MYGLYGLILCDSCSDYLNNVDYILIKTNNSILHYCNEECKNNRNQRLNQTNELPQLFGKDFIHIRLQANKTRFYIPEVPLKRF